ncbi:cyanophycinase [Sorangium cellulosum]|uniref:Cyanophycinase n=1 Tax=Sorangium cellulosum TaxID=56 RepID=A0A150SLF4_SORCE|nr:cyanophycinase [Sorangium cellulosum]KYF93275.1 cyanophycinase [Sorangium cellulosum]
MVGSKGNAEGPDREPPAGGPGGALVLIGGHEDKEGEREILRDVVARAGGRPIVVATVASDVAGELWVEYERVFRALGAAEVAHLDIAQRGDAGEARWLGMLEGAGCVFFTGGDQLKITSKLGGSRIADAICAVYRRGGTIAGTSAGASVMSETMLVGGAGEESARVRGAVRMAPGLGLVRDLLVDQHFAQRGRLGRLLGAVAHNPRLLGIGIDEDTAAAIEPDRRLRALGTGAVYVVDGRNLSHTNIGEEEGDRVLSLFDVRLHVLSAGDSLDLESGRPAPGQPR